MVTVQQLSNIINAYKRWNYEYADKIISEIILSLEKEKKYKVAKELRIINSQPFMYMSEKKQNNWEYGLSSIKNNIIWQDNWLYELRDSNISMKNIILSTQNTVVTDEIISNYLNKDLFKSYNLDSRIRILVYWPPWTWKTLFAYALAWELNIPIMHVQLDQLISSYLWETGKNIRKIFENASTWKYIILLDEFDAIAKQRDDVSELWELKRVVTVLLQHIDQLNSNNILIAATNHPHLLDSAVTRRFEFLLNIDNLDYLSLIDLYKLYLNEIPYSKKDYSELAKESIWVSWAIIKQIIDKWKKKWLTLNQTTKVKRKREDNYKENEFIKNYILNEILLYRFRILAKSIGWKTTKELSDSEKMKIASIIKSWQQVWDKKYSYKDYAEIIHIPVTTLNYFVKTF